MLDRYFLDVRLFSNLKNIIITQGFQIVFPFLSYFVLLRYLDIEGYGEYVYTVSLVSIISVFIEFGTRLSGLKFIASVREARRKSIVFGVMILRTSMLILIFGILTPVLTYYFEFTAQYVLVLFFGSIVELFNLDWYFNAINKMKSYTLSLVLNRLLFLGLVLVVIRIDSSSSLVVIANYVALLVAYVFNFTRMLKNEGVGHLVLNLVTVKLIFRKSYGLFFSNSINLVYSKIGKVVLGGLSGMEAISIYDFAEKVGVLIRMPSVVISRSVLPLIVEERSWKKSLRYSWLAFTVSVVNFVVISLILILLAGTLVKQLHVHYWGIFPILLAALISGINAIFGRNLLYAFDKLRQYIYQNISGSTVYIVGLLLLHYFSNITILSLGLLLVFSELIVASLILVNIKKGLNERTKE